jgi:hypothetical protein
VGYFEKWQLEPLKQQCHAGCMAKKASVRPAKNPARRPRDVNQLAQQLVRESTEKHEAEPATPTDSEISRVMAELGRRGGKVGGKNRAASMTPERRSEIALKAARSRWDKGQRPS